MLLDPDCLVVRSLKVSLQEAGGLSFFPSLLLYGARQQGIMVHGERREEHESLAQECEPDKGGHSKAFTANFMSTSVEVRGTNQLERREETSFYAQSSVYTKALR